jgi:hypothetical protein
LIGIPIGIVISVTTKIIQEPIQVRGTGAKGETITGAVGPRVRVEHRVNPWLIVVLGIVLTIVAAFVVAWLRTPPLPKVEAVWDSTTRGRAVVTKGELLAQPGAVWYIFDDKNNRLTAIPNDEVDTVNFSK